MEADIWTDRSGADLGADVTRAINVAGFEAASRRRESLTPAARLA